MINQYMILLEVSTGAVESIKEYSPMYWAPVFTLVVGILGIISQIYVNYYIEKRKRKSEELKLRKDNAKNFYIPLLVLLRRYDCYRKLLSQDSRFRIGDSYFGSSEYDAEAYSEFAKIYDELYVFLQKGYIPTNNSLDLEINQLLKHVIIVKYLFTSPPSSLNNDLLEEKECRGYVCKDIEDMLVEEIFEIKNS